MPSRQDSDDADSRIIVSGHQVDVGDTLRAHATEELTALGHKYCDGTKGATCTFSRRGHGGFACAIRVHSGRDLHFEGEGEHAAAQGAFALALFLGQSAGSLGFGLGLTVVGYRGAFAFAAAGVLILALWARRGARVG